MLKKFYIKCTLKTFYGFECFGQFFIGHDQDFATAIFKQLRGTEEVSEDNVLQLDFVESVNNLPLNLKVIRCNLKDMSENARIITKEMFKYYNLNSQTAT